MATGGGLGSSTIRQVGGVWDDDNKIVVGIDIGTTQSAVALTFLEKGARQEIHRISKWPGQGEQDQRAKIPTVIWYNLETKKAELFGAEAMSRDGRETAEDNGWFLVKHFKLHLQPKELRKADMRLDPLPTSAGITLAQIYSDFLGYILAHIEKFVESRIPLGKKVWENYKPTMEVVIAHPNGWDTPEQDFLRKAAIDSGFVDADNASRQVQFVTEAEASVHYCIHYSNLGNKLEPGTNLVVCDAGGSTVDTTMYSVVSATPVLQLGEAQLSDSVQAGGILVNMKFETFLRRALNELDLGLDPTQVNDFEMAGMEDFENFAKRNYGNSEESLTESKPVSIRVAGSRSKTYGTGATKIHRGNMKVPNSAIKECFEASTGPILSSVGEQLKNHNIQHILLVGGFGDSPYLHAQFESHFESDDCHVVLANESTSKAVAEGSVIWNTLCSVVSRTPRGSFGIICAAPCLPWMPEAEGREAFLGPQGVPMIPGQWVQITKKGVPVEADVVFREQYHRLSMENNLASIPLSMDLYNYSGDDDDPMWGWDKNGELLPNFKKICTITAVVYNVEGVMKKERGLLGMEYWDIAVDICIRFGTTELQAYLEWEQNGLKLKGPAAVVPGRPIDL